MGIGEEWSSVFAGGYRRGVVFSVCWWVYERSGLQCMLVGIGEEWSLVFAGGYRRGAVFSVCWWV